MVFEGVEGLGGCAEAEHDLDMWACLDEPAHDPRDEVGAGCTGCADAQRADLGADEPADAVVGLIEQRVGSSDVAGEELARRCELEGRSSGDQGDADLSFQGGDVLGHGGLAEVEPSSSTDEGAFGGERLEARSRRASSNMPESYVDSYQRVLACRARVADDAMGDQSAGHDAATMDTRNGDGGGRRRHVVDRHDRQCDRVGGSRTERGRHGRPWRRSPRRCGLGRQPRAR